MYFHKELINFDGFLDATEVAGNEKGIVVTYDNFANKTCHSLFKILDGSILNEEGFSVSFAGDKPRNNIRLGIHMSHRYNEINGHLPDFPILSYDMPSYSKAPIGGGFLIQPYAKQVIRGGFGMGLRDSYRVRDKQFETIAGEVNFDTILVDIVQELMNNGYGLYHGGILKSILPRYVSGIELVRADRAITHLFETMVGHGAHYAYILSQQIELKDIMRGDVGDICIPETTEGLLEVLERQWRK